MTKICIIGDSHVAALLSGWRAIKDSFPEFTITAFAAPVPQFAELSVSDGQLVPSSEKLREFFKRSSDGLETIENSYDRYMVCGLDWSMRRMFQSIKKFRCEKQVSNRRIPLSDDCYMRAMAGLLRNAPAGRTLTNLRQITARAIVMIPTPMRSEANAKPVIDRLIASGDARIIASHFNLAAGRVADEIGVEFLAQPTETLRTPFQTQDLYKRGAVRAFVGDLNEELPETDVQHMNAAYGEIVLRAAFSAVGGGVS